MRILQVVVQISTEASGPAYTVPALCTALAEEGCEVDLVTLQGDRTLAAERMRHEQHPVSCGMHRLGVSEGMRKALYGLAARADIVHGHSLWMMPNVYPAWAARAAGKPLVMSPRGTLSSVTLRRRRMLKAAFWRLLQGPAARQAACLHATSPHERDDIRAFGLGAPVATVPNGIHVPEHAPARDRSGPRRLLYLGRLHPIKGIDNLLKAWGEAHRDFPDWVLRIVGPDENGHRGELETLQRQLGLARVEFVGPLYGDAKWAEYFAAEAYVLPSHSENFGISLAEAMACGLPVVSTTGTPWTDLDRRGVGWTVAPDAGALAKALRAVLASPAGELRAIGDRGRDWMKAEFSWSGVARETIAVYRWILEGGARPRCVSANGATGTMQTESRHA